MRLDPLPFTEDYFAVYNGVIILNANPYFNFARQLGLSSVATGGYISTGRTTRIYHLLHMLRSQCVSHVRECFIDTFVSQDLLPPALHLK
jgi:hypothetical protein